MRTRLRICRRCKGPGTFNTIPDQRVCDRCRAEPGQRRTYVTTSRQRAWGRARDEANAVLRARHEDEWQAIFDGVFDDYFDEENKKRPPA